MRSSFLNIVFFLCICLSVSGQKGSNFQVDAGMTQNYKGFFKLFDGVLDVGAGYNQRLINDLYGGFAFRISFLSRQNTPSRTTVYKPQLNLHYYFNLSKKVTFIPVISLGYSLLNLSNNEFEYRELQTGLNPGGELRVLWKSERKIDFFLFGRFDYIYLDQDVSFTRVEYYRKVYLTSFGLGIRIKSSGNEE